MAIFRRRRSTLAGASAEGLPTSLSTALAKYGQFEFDPQGSGVVPSDFEFYDSFVAPYYERAQRDPDGFSADLAELVLPIGGWALYGGQRLVVDLIGGDYQGEHYLAMQDAALEWLHAQGYAYSCLSGYEWNRWVSTRGFNAW